MAGAKRKYTSVQSVIDALESGQILKTTLYCMASRYAKKGDLGMATMIREALKQVRS